MSRVHRALSAFNHTTHRWASINLNIERSPLPLCSSIKQKLSLVSWNLNALDSRPVARSKVILDHILMRSKSPDIILLQEVTSGVRDTLLNDSRVRSSFLVTDAEDNTSFHKKDYATMTLLSNKRFASDPGPQLGGERGEACEGRGKLMVEGVFRMPLPSSYGRDALCVNITAPVAPDMALRFVNVHLDPFNHLLPCRAQQMDVLAGVLREPKCGGGIIAGDFNAVCHAEDDALVERNGLVDAWVALHGREGLDGATWGVGMEQRRGRKPGRLDKVVLLGLKAEEMDILQPGLIEVHRPAQPSLYKPWSDHCGLRCTFTI